MKVTRGMKVAAIGVSCVMALAACSESDTPSDAASSDAAIDCASGTLSGEGSSFQKNAITEWINYHKGFLEPIQAETSTAMNADSRRTFAGFCLEQWEKVAVGEQEFVYINEHFLKDYNTEVRNRAPKISAPQVLKPQKDSKPWWQFWK